jgi:hypothetical protein
LLTINISTLYLQWNLHIYWALIYMISPYVHMFHLWNYWSDFNGIWYWASTVKALSWI